MQGLFRQEQEVLPHMGLIAVGVDAERFRVFTLALEEAVVGLAQFLMIARFHYSGLLCCLGFQRWSSGASCGSCRRRAG